MKKPRDNGFWDEKLAELRAKKSAVLQPIPKPFEQESVKRHPLFADRDARIEARRDRLSKRAQDLADIFSQANGAALLEKSQKLPDLIKTAVDEARNMIDQFDFPIRPTLEYEKVKNVKSAGSSDDILSGTVVLLCKCATLTGTKQSFEIPVTIKGGKVVPPSVINFQGKDFVLAQSTVNAIVQRASSYELMPVRNMFDPPQTRDERATVSKTRNEIGYQPREGIGPVSICRRQYKKAQEEDNLLRDVDVDGYRLRMWDAGVKYERGQHRNYISYEFADPSGKVIFSGDDYSPGMGTSIDGDEAVRGLLGFLTLSPGDTDDEYFEKYTPEQMDFAQSNAEALSLWGMDPQEDDEDDFYHHFKDWGEKNASSRVAQSLDEFTLGYMEAALWSSGDGEEYESYESFDFEDIAVYSRAHMISDCAKFQEENAEDLAIYYETSGRPEDHAGHDFWLTRNGHGVGFWDREGDKAALNRLTEASHKFGEEYLYLGDEGKLYIGGHEGPKEAFRTASMGTAVPPGYAKCKELMDKAQEEGLDTFPRSWIHVLRNYILEVVGTYSQDQWMTHLVNDGYVINPYGGNRGREKTAQAASREYPYEELADRITEGRPENLHYFEEALYDAAAMFGRPNADHENPLVSFATKFVDKQVISEDLIDQVVAFLAEVAAWVREDTKDEELNGKVLWLKNKLDGALGEWYETEAFKKQREWEQGLDNGGDKTAQVDDMPEDHKLPEHEETDEVAEEEPLMYEGTKTPIEIGDSIRFEGKDAPIRGTIVEIDQELHKVIVKSKGMEYRVEIDDIKPMNQTFKKMYSSLILKVAPPGKRGAELVDMFKNQPQVDNPWDEAWNAYQNDPHSGPKDEDPKKFEGMNAPIEEN
jgi:hypothetical protein